MQQSKKVKIIQSDLMRVGVRHGTGKSTENVESFMWALALTLLIYAAGSHGNNVKRGYKLAKSMVKSLSKKMKRDRV